MEIHITVNESGCSGVCQASFVNDNLSTLIAQGPPSSAEAGETCPGGSARIGGGFPVAWIEPVDGWTLRSFTYWDGDGFLSPAWFARGPDRDELLPVSRFLFEPTQARFAWLVRNGFPKCPGIGPWTDGDIDEAIAQSGALS